MNQNDYQSFLRTVAVFRDLQPDTLAALATVLESRDVKAGEYLFREGDAADFMFVVVRGKLAVCKSAGELVEIALRTMGEGEVGGLTSMAVVKKRSASLRAEGPVSVLTIAREKFLALLEAHPDLARGVISLLGDKVRGKTAQLATLLAPDSQGRLPVAVFDTKPYDRRFLQAAAGDSVMLHFFETRLHAKTAGLARGFPVVCAFVNDVLDAAVLEQLSASGVQLIALRCAGFNNVDVTAAAAGGISVARVPGYSPHAVAEHTMAMILTLNRKLHRAYQRVREGNFRLDGLEGFDLYGRCAGIIGLGKIGRCLAKIMRGFGMEVLAQDAYPDAALAAELELRYATLDELLSRADVISLNAPLTRETHHLINADRIARMKRGVMLINTSRGALVDTGALIDGLKSGQIGSAGLDVYEEESAYFFQDRSSEPITDDVLARLLTFPNVLVTSHQAFLTEDALRNIAATTLANIAEFQAGKRGDQLTNAVLPG